MMKHINSELRSILHDRLKSNHFLATLGSELDDQLFKELTILNILYER